MIPNRFPTHCATCQRRLEPDTGSYYCSPRCEEKRRTSVGASWSGKRGRQLAAQKRLAARRKRESDE